jgi:hypothetical protein
MHNNNTVTGPGFIPLSPVPSEVCATERTFQMSLQYRICPVELLLLSPEP